MKAKIIHRTIKSHSSLTKEERGNSRPLRTARLHTEAMETQPPITATRKQIQMRTRGNAKLFSKTSRIATLRPPLYSQTSRIMITQPPEQLYQQNMGLKKRMNELQQDLQREKIRHLQETRSMSKLQKRLDIPFEKELYCAERVGQQALRNQYNKLKRMYEEKTIQYDQLYCSSLAPSLAEYKTYADQLMRENKRLVGKVNAGAQTKCDLCLGIMDRYNLQEIKLWQQEQLDKINQYRSTIKGLREKLTNAFDKHSFLDKIILTKDNQMHSSNKQIRLLSRRIKEIERENEHLSMSRERQKKQYQEQMVKMKKIHQEVLEAQKNIFMRGIEGLKLQIQKLDVENRYYKTIFGTRQNAMEEQSCSLLNMGLERKISPQASIKKQAQLNKSRRKRRVTVDFKLDLTRNVLQSVLDGSIKLSEAEEEEQEVRQVKSCKYKNSPYGLKMRKINVVQVQAFREELVYRLIGHNFHVEQVKLKFDWNQDPTTVGSKEEQKWRLTYISMREVMDILRNYPFQLGQEEANLLARYVVEDHSLQYVYCDQQNQIERVIAKSIIKAYLGEYEIADAVLAQEEWRTVLENHGRNLKAALGTYAPEGVISKDKLLNVCFNLGMVLEVHVQNWLISHLLMKSPQGLQRLSYSLLFS